MKKILFALAVFSIACATQKPVSTFHMKQPVVVYKTKNNYNNHVPVLLSDDKSEIVMYPAPTDLYYQEKLALPTPLKKGYLLDNRGINRNVAFLKLTYKEYAKLEKAPAYQELYAMIIDKDPLLEFYSCGNREDYKNIVSELNKLIVKGNLAECGANKI